jgi:hypothetical protein
MIKNKDIGTCLLPNLIKMCISEANAKIFWDLLTNIKVYQKSNISGHVRRTRPGGLYERWVKFFSTDDNGNNFLRRLVNFENQFEFFFIFFTYDV